MAKVKKTIITTLEVDDVKAGTYSLTTGQVKRLIAGDTVQLQASLPQDIFDSIRLCDAAKEELEKGMTLLDKEQNPIVIGKASDT